MSNTTVGEKMSKAEELVVYILNRYQAGNVSQAEEDTLRQRLTKHIQREANVSYGEALPLAKKTMRELAEEAKKTSNQEEKESGEMNKITQVIIKTDGVLDTVVAKTSYGVGVSAGVSVGVVNKVTKNYLVKNPLTRWVSKKAKLSIKEMKAGYQSGCKKITK